MTTDYTTEAQRMIIRNKMNEWRHEMRGLPTEYVAIHEQCARADLPRFLAGQRARLLHTEMVSDGWGGPMKVLRVVAEYENGTLVDFRWSDSNGGSWFKKCPSGGSALVETPENRPGFL